MKQTETLQKLVDLLGRSENDPELQALLALLHKDLKDNTLLI